MSRPMADFMQSVKAEIRFGDLRFAAGHLCLGQPGPGDAGGRRGAGGAQRRLPPRGHPSGQVPARRSEGQRGGRAPEQRELQARRLLLPVLLLLLLRLHLRNRWEKVTELRIANFEFRIANFRMAWIDLSSNDEPKRSP